MSDLEAELGQLSSTLEEKGAELRGIIKEEKCRKEAELQVENLFFLSLERDFISEIICHVSIQKKKWLPW